VPGGTPGGDLTQDLQIDVVHDDGSRGIGGFDSGNGLRDQEVRRSVALVGRPVLAGQT
jgi:hypothetical protein